MATSSRKEQSIDPHYQLFELIMHSRPNETYRIGQQGSVQCSITSTKHPKRRKNTPKTTLKPENHIKDVENPVKGLQKSRKTPG
ncbi:MAG TPA: hypothetical protein O0X27_01185, partial [Methanocorpusculum sp.]|nr:hypothetical protein [Methanocorpusculum sp.]